MVIIASITVSVIVILNSGVSRTVMIYMVGSNLESTNGLASSDLASIKNKDSNTKVLLIAGGTNKWDNNNELCSSINDCINIENNIKDIKLMNELTKNNNLKEKKKFI